MLFLVWLLLWWGAAAGGPMAPKKSRDVYKGSDKEMLEKIMPLAKQKGVEFIDYDENPVISKARLDREKMQKCHDVLKIMHELHNKLNFPKKQTEKVFHSIAASMKKNGNWMTSKSRIGGLRWQLGFATWAT